MHDRLTHMWMYHEIDVYNIVATNDFNMGAMENKGLNIFNSAYVLADPKTATDIDYERILAVIAHEYFHNWTGITAYIHMITYVRTDLVVFISLQVIE